MPTKILITGAGGPAAIAFMRAVQGADFEFFACDIDPYAAGLYLVPAENRALIHRGDHPEIVNDLLGLCRKHAIDVLVPTVDSELEKVARARDAFNAIGTKVLVASTHTLEVCLDKLALARACKGHVRVPHTATPAAIAVESCPLPVIVKPRRGSGSRGIHIARTVAELEQFTASGDVLVQELLPGAEYSVDVLATTDGRVVAAVPRERLKVDSGIAVTARVVRDPELEEIAIRVAKTIRLTGVANVQLKRDAHGRPALLEVNPRFPGTMPLTVAAGVNMPLLALQNLLGASLPERCLYKEIAVVRTWAETFIEPSELTTMERATPAPTTSLAPKSHAAR